MDHVANHILLGEIVARRKADGYAGLNRESLSYAKMLITPALSTPSHGETKERKETQPW